MLNALPEKYRRREMTMPDPRADPEPVEILHYNRDNVLAALDRFCADSGALWLKDVSLTMGETWETLLEDYKDDKDVQKKIACCVQRQESRAVRYGMIGSLDKAMVMKVLEEKHSWRRAGGDVNIGVMGKCGIVLMTGDGKTIDMTEQRRINENPTE
jgi:hypothetical protein